jgi:hypothetical protein
MIKRSRLLVTMKDANINLAQPQAETMKMTSDDEAHGQCGRI